MNRDWNPIFFNKRQDQLMAVAETAQVNDKIAAGKSAEGSGSGTTLPRRCHSVASKVAVAMWLTVSALPMVWSQIIADPTAAANQRPTVLSDSTGRPLVNIQTPSATGLSRNTYEQFDVPTSGIVINNSASNPWLSNGVLAKTILNEVNSTSQSYINGAITVNGAAAQVIVANPNGITVNGGSFINANRATLTTGIAQVSNGALTSFNIRSNGGITIGAGGLNNSATPYTDIMSRTVSVVGALQAQNLGIITGLQTVDYSTGFISDEDTNTYAAGELAIDTAALGGMYAGNISILATEAGLGVRNQGTWQATGGQIVVTADGLLQNSGSISADVVSLATVTGNIENSGSIKGTQAVLISSGADIDLFGVGLKQTAGSTVFISATGSVNLGDEAFDYPIASITEVSSTATGGQVSIIAGQNINLNSGTSIASNKDVQLSSDAMVVASGASITSTSGNVTALAGTGLDLSNSTVTGQQVHLETGAVFEDTAADLFVTDGTVRGATQTTLLSTGNIRISSPKANAVSGGGNVHIQSTKAVNITADTTVTAGQHMSVMAGTALNLQAERGTTATNGQKVNLNATGNMLLSGNSVTAIGSNLSAGQDLSIEAYDGRVFLDSLSNAGGASVDHISLNAGKDLNVSAFKGELYTEGLQASAQNINLMSNGNTRISNTFVSNNGVTITPVSSTLTAREDLTVGSINTTAGASNYVGVTGSSLNAAGKVRVLTNGTALLSPWTQEFNYTYSSNPSEMVVQPAHSSITAGSVVIQGDDGVYIQAAHIRTNGDKSTTAKSGDITVTATGGDVTFSHLFYAYTDYPNQFNSSGNIALHANGNLTHWRTQANAGGSLSNTSATGQIKGVHAILVAKDVLSLASKGAQTHLGSYYSGGATTVFNETGHLALNSTRVQAVGTSTDGLSSVSGQTSIESGGTLGIDAASVLVGTTDLSIIQGQGDITINPTSAGRGTLVWSQLGANRKLTLAARNGNMTFTGSSGSNGVGSSQKVNLYFNGDLNLVANNITLQGSHLQTGGALNITATTGDINTKALQVTKTEAGFINYYWDSARLAGNTGVNVRAAGNISMDGVSVYASGSNDVVNTQISLDGSSVYTPPSDGVVNIQSGGNTTIAGNYIRWRVDNRPYNGWFQDEKYIWESFIYGSGGVNIGALGGTLTLNATTIYAPNSKASLQALGNINLEAAQEHKLHQASSLRSYTSCSWIFFCNDITETTYHHREYLTNKPMTVAAQDIEVKAGNNLNTYGTKLNASRNLYLEAGDAINYYAVYDQQDISDTTYQKKSLWGIVTWDSSTFVNSTSKLSGQPTQLQSLGDILSNSGSYQLLQGTKVSYGGTAAFNAGVGEKARADARIILEGIKNSTTQMRTQESNYVVWQKQVNQGTSQETLVLPSFTGPTKPTFTAPGGLSVQIAEGDFTSQINALAAQPGMGYLNDLAVRTDVNWQPVKLAFEQWDYKQEGLTPAGAALLAAAVAWAMPAGAGVSGINSLLGIELTGTSALMTNAAFVSLASQASIIFVNNKGDVNKTLKELGRSQTVKATIAAALTAGVLGKLNATSALQELSAKTGFSDKLAYNLINATGRALTNTAIDGGDLQSALKAALVSGLIDTAHGQAASQLKVLEADWLAHKLAHALVGCVAGEVAGGSCKDGAIGAAVGEIVAKLMPPANGIAYSDSEKNNILALSKLVAGATSAYAGGDAQTAITTAEVAVQNNAFVPVLVGLVWLADKAWTAYEVSQDIAAIRDGTKTVDQVAQEKGEEYLVGIIVGNLAKVGYKAVKGPLGNWLQEKIPHSNSSNGPLVNINLVKKDEALLAGMKNRSPGERVSFLRQRAAEAAQIHGFIKDRHLSRLNGRTVYRGRDNKLYALDTQHGEFELVNPKTGKHEGAVKIFTLQQLKEADPKRDHDLKLG